MNDVLLGEVCDVVMGQAPPGESYNSRGEGWPLVAGAGDFGESAPTPLRFTTRPTRVSEPGDLLLCVRATIGDRNWSDRGYCLGRGVAALRPAVGRLDKDYLWHWLAVAKPTLERRARGSTFKQVTREAVESLRLPLPPLAEQRRIAAVLDKADAVRRKRRESLRLLDEFLRSAFLEMFGDPVRNEKGWGMARLGERLTFLTSGSRGWARYYSTTGRPFLRIQNVGHNELRLDDLVHVQQPPGAEADRTLVQPGDVLLSITADLGRTAVIPAGFPLAHINQHLAILRVTGVEPLYVAEYLASPGGRHQLAKLNRQAVKAGLNFDDIRSLRIPLPSAELQRRFVDVYRGRLELRARLNRATEETRILFDSLAERAFASGRDLACGMPG